MNSRTWEESSLYIEKELEDLNKKYGRIERKIDALHDSVIILKMKAGVWGLLGAAIPVVIGIAVVFLKSHI